MSPKHSEKKFNKYTESRCHKREREQLQWQGKASLFYSSFMFMFMFMHLADAFIQSDLQIKI